MQILRRFPELIILTVLAFITRLWNLFHPAAVVFDEVYFKIYAGNYLNGAYYFDPHPPLGKLILGGWAWLTQQDVSILISTTDPAVVMRILPAIAGALIIPVFFIFLRQLGASRKVSALGAGLLLLDNALLVESRFILLDSMLVLFGLGAVSSYLAARKHQGRRRYLLIGLAALLAGLCVSIKWTGLTAIGIIGLVWLIEQLKNSRARADWKKWLVEGFTLVIVPILVYVSSFWIHFSLLPNTGQGNAFMSQKFQTTLIGSPTYDPNTQMSFVDKFVDLNHAMIQSEHSLQTATHPYGSKWSSWPLMLKPIYYWQGDVQPNGTQGHIYFLGNPFVWWGILVVIIAGCLASTQALHRLRPYRFALAFLVLAYFANLLPFIGIVRVMFLYHYLFALIFSLAFASILLGALADWHTDSKRPWQFSSTLSRNLYLGIVTIAIIGFLYFAPLSYGVPLTPQELGQHMWLPSWR